MNVVKIKDEPDIDPTEFVFEAVDISAPTKNISVWSNAETKQLIDLYKSFISEVGPLERFKRKKDMWSEISLQIPSKSSKQCEERFKTLLRRKKNGIIEKVYISEGKRKLLGSEDKADDEKELQLINKHIENCQTDDNIATFQKFQEWSNDETQLLIELFERYIAEVGPQKRFMKEKDMWIEISTNFLNKDAAQCLQRYNTIVKRKKKKGTRVYISRKRAKMIAFKLKRIAENTKTIKGVFTLKEDGITNHAIGMNNLSKKSEQNRSQDKTEKTGENKEVLPITETLFNIAKKQEASKERRHTEKMEAIEKIQNIMQQILNSKTDF